MKLLFHEKRLILLTLIFAMVLFVTALIVSDSPTIALSSETDATPYYIDINTATAEELDLLDGIGPAIANRIIEFRERNGNFKSYDDLRKVSGIGASTLNKIKNYIVVN